MDYNMRKNISKACTFCKSRKRKCDGGVPCNFCQKKNKLGVCSYDVIDKRSLRYSYLKQKAIEASNEVESAGDGSTKLAPITTKLAPIYTSPPMSEHFATVLHTENQSFTQQHLQHQQQQQSQHQQQYIPKPDPYEDGYLDNMSGIFTYIGESSNFSFLTRSKHLFKLLNLNGLITTNHTNHITHINHTTPIQSLDLSKSAFVNSPFNLQIFGSSKDYIDLNSTNMTPLPPRELCDVFIDLFLSSSNQLLYVINDDYLKNHIVEEAYNKKPTQSADYKKLSQLYLILAIGSIFFKCVQKHEDHHLSHLIFPDQNLSQNYFNSAMIISETLKREGNLWYLEVETLSSLYYQLVNQKLSCWLKLSNAIKIADSLGLNKRISNESIKNKDQIIHRRKLWRTLYITDRASSIDLGKQVNIDDSYWDDKSSLPIQADSSNNLKSVCENQYVKVSILSGEIYHYIYNKQTFEASKILELVERLNCWANDLPLQLKADQILKLNNSKFIDINLDKVTNRYNQLPLLFLHSFHLKAVILISKPFFLYETTKDIEELISSIKNGSQLKRNLERVYPTNSLVKIMADCCLSGSIFVVKFCWCFYKNKLHPLKPFALVDNLFGSSLVISLKALVQSVYLIQLMNNKEIQLWDKNLNDLKDYIKILNLSSLMLKDYSLTDDLSLNYYMIINDMIDSILSFLKSSIEILSSNFQNNDFNITNFKDWINNPFDFNDLDLDLIGPKYKGYFGISHLNLQDEDFEKSSKDELSLFNFFLSNIRT